MRKISILIVLWFALSGCAVILVGAGAAGGYAIGKDYIQGETDKDFNRVYDSAVNVADGMGVIESRFSNSSTGKIKASVETSKREGYTWVYVGKRFTERAKDFNRRLVEDKIARLETDVQKKDKYGRTLAYCFVEDTFVNARMLQEGFALLYTIPPNVKYIDLLVKAQ